MKILLKFLLASSLLIVADAWVIDPTCANLPGMTNALAAAMSIVFRKALDASTEILRNPRDPNVQAVLNILLGGDETKIDDAQQRLFRIQSLANQRQPPAPIGDIQICCDTSRYTTWTNPSNPKDQRLVDPLRNRDGITEATTGELAKMCASSGLFSSTTIEAYTSTGQPGKTEIAPDVMTLCPPWLEKKLPQGYLSPANIVAKAASGKAKAILSKVAQTLHGTPMMTQMDSLALFEHTILHELTHTSRSGYALDLPTDEDAYGWLNCAKYQLSGNADTLAYLAESISLILHSGYVPDKYGTLNRI